MRIWIIVLLRDVQAPSWSIRRTKTKSRMREMCKGKDMIRSMLRDGKFSMRSTGETLRAHDMFGKLALERLNWFESRILLNGRLRKTVGQSVIRCA